MFLLVYGGSLWLGSLWPPFRQYGDTLILAAMGVACFTNFARNRTLHCGLSGPIFIAGALVAALTEARIWNIDLRSVWAVVLVGAALAFLIELRTVGQSRSNARDTMTSSSRQRATRSAAAVPNSRW